MRLTRAAWGLVVLATAATACGDSSEPAGEATTEAPAPATTTAGETTTEASDPAVSAAGETTTPVPTAGPTAESSTVWSGRAAGTTDSTPSDQAGRCLVRLHGKGGVGGDPAEADGVTILSPTGNADGWGARQWLYFPEDEYEAARRIVAEAVEPCERVIVNGFSNGAAFAAKLYCQGETFDGRLEGVVVDDPVVDASVEGCAPAPGVAVTLYWTGALESTAQPGWDCSEGDWTCEGGTTIGIDAFAAALGTEVLESPFDEHQWYVDAPETMAW